MSYAVSMLIRLPALLRSPVIDRKHLQGSHVLLNLRRLAMDPRRHPSILSFTELVSGRVTLSELHFGSTGQATVIELQTMHRERAD